MGRAAWRVLAVSSLHVNYLPSNSRQGTEAGTQAQRARLSSQSVFGFLVGQKTPKRTGMTNLGFPGLSSQSISGFLGPFRPENPKTDWDDKPGLPRVVIPVRFGFFWPRSARKPQNELGGQAWASQGCHPSLFWDYVAPFGQKTPKRIGMTSLGFPGLLSQSVWVFLSLFGQKTPK